MTDECVEFGGTLMSARVISNGLPIDPSTSRAITRGIGEKLKQTIGPDTAFPDRLQQLLDEMQARETRDSSDAPSKR